MILQSAKVPLLVLWWLLTQYVVLFETRAAPHDRRIRIELSADEKIVVPKHATVKIIEPPLSYINEKFNPILLIPPPPLPPLPPSSSLRKPLKTNNKKQPVPSTKYVKPHNKGILVGKLMSSLKIELEKNLCCGKKNEWKKEKEIGLKDPLHVTLGIIQPATVFNSVPVNSYKYKDPHVKPVTEHIEDDIKYDFRTKTHFL